MPGASIRDLFIPKRWNWITHLKFNIAPEKLWLDDYFPIGKAYFQGLG